MIVLYHSWAAVHFTMWVDPPSSLQNEQLRLLGLGLDGRVYRIFRDATQWA